MLDFRVLAFCLLVGSVCFAEDRSASEIDDRIIEAEKELADEIRRVYVDASAQYRMKHYAEAERLFGDCYSLFFASADYLSEPEKLRPMADDCERHLESLARVRKQEAALGGWKARLTALRLKRFQVQDAGLSETLEYFRQRVARTMRVAPPEFVILPKSGVGKARLTLDVEDISAIYVLEELARQAGWEVRFEKHAIVFAEPHSMR